MEQNNENILTGQGAQQNLPARLDTSVANDLLAQVRSTAAEKAAQITGKSVGKFGTNVQPGAVKQPASGLVRNLVNSPSSRGGDGLYNTEQIEMRRNVAWIPSEFDPGLEYTQDETSSTGVIIADSIKQFGMSLMTLEDKAYVGLGGIVSKVSGNEFGNEMRDRAYESLDAKLRDMSYVATREKDVETLTAKFTMGAASMLEMMAVGAMTGGIAPLAQMGVDVFGEGTYNNMNKYARENGGSVEGYEGNWAEIGIDLANAAVQVVIEQKLGVGSGRFYKGMGGNFLKEGLEGFLQEGSQEFLGDFGEYLKGNEEAQIFADRWQDYLIAGVIGGVMQGALGAATYDSARAKADQVMTDMAFGSIMKANPNMSENLARKQAREFAREFNTNQERALAREGYQELNDRIEANLDRGRVRDAIVESDMADRADTTIMEAIDMQADATRKLSKAVEAAYADGQSIMTKGAPVVINPNGKTSLVKPELFYIKKNDGSLKVAKTNVEGAVPGSQLISDYNSQFKPVAPSAANNSVEYYIENAYRVSKMKNQSQEFKDFWKPIARKYGLNPKSTFISRDTMNEIRSDFVAGNMPSQSTIQTMVAERNAVIAENTATQKVERQVKKSKEDTARVISDAVEKKYGDTEVGKKERGLTKRLREMGVEIESERYVPIKLAEMQGDAESAVRLEGGIDYALGIINGKIKNSSILRETWYVALENYANETADAKLVDQLRATGIAAEATELGQRIAALKDYNQADGTINGKRAVDIIEKSFSKLSRSEQAEYAKAIDSFITTLAESDKKGAAKIAAIVKSWEC